MLREVAKMSVGRYDPHLILEIANQDMVLPSEARIDSQLHWEMELSVKLLDGVNPSQDSGWFL